MQSSAADQALVRHYRRALVVLRTFVGIVYLSNGLAKLLGLHAVHIGPWMTYLINRDDALGIQRANSSTSPGFLRDVGLAIANHWSVLQWVVTAGEVCVGIALVAGLYTRASAIAGLCLAGGAFIFTLGAGGWTYDYLFEPILLGVLVMAPGLPGIDLLRRRASTRPSS